MSDHFASCRCGQLRALCAGEPIRVSVCHCLDCQKRSGSAFAAQARWPDGQVVLEGAYRERSHLGENGLRTVFRFCPRCGATIAYAAEALPGLTAIPVGSFADPDFPAPTTSVYEERKHRWTAILGDRVEHIE